MLGLRVVCFFFFKQKTAYEMRISDWSSDVCSSDLLQEGFFRQAERDDLRALRGEGFVLGDGFMRGAGHAFGHVDAQHLVAETPETGDAGAQIGSASCGERVCQSV